MPEQSTAVLSHDCFLLDAPSLDAQPVALLGASMVLNVSARHAGFATVTLLHGLAGYLPNALLGSEPPPEAIPVVLHQPVALSDTPTALADDQIIPTTEAVALVKRGARFSLIRRASGKTGYVPTILLKDGQSQLKQPVRFYAAPEPGGQQLGAVIATPEERVVLLGEDGPALLLQRSDGRIGFAPAALVRRQPEPDLIMPIGPIDLGWLALGGVWGLANWLGVAQAVAYGGLVPEALHAAVFLAVVIAAASAIILRGRKPPLARSFGAGALLAYLVILTGGRLFF